jgi:site-specific recombinase XerD
MKRRERHVLTLPDGRRVRFSIHSRAGEPFYFVGFRGLDGRRLERSTKEVSQKRALDSAEAIIKEDHTPGPLIETVTWDEAETAMLAAMRAQNLRERSIDDYRMILRVFRDAFPTYRGPGNIKPGIAELFKTKRMQAGKSPRTVAGNLNKLSVIWGKWFIQKCKLVSMNPWEEVEHPKTDKLTPRYLEAAEEAAFLAWLRRRWDGWRLPVLFFEVKAATGCRITELCSLPTANLRDGRIIFVSETTKGRRTRRPKLPAGLYTELDKLADGRTYAWERYSEQLRTMYRGRKLRGYVRDFTPKRFKRWLQSQVTDYCHERQEDPEFRPFTAHDFRGTAMSKAVAAGATVDQASIAFGCHPETMRKHYLHLDEQGIADAVLDRIQQGST